MFNDVKDIRTWRIDDPCPGQALSDINPVSLRATTLLVRSADNPILHRNLVNVDGAVIMMRGLDYHYRNFMGLVGQLAQRPRLSRAHEMPVYYDLDHEVVAYINRAGQFIYFAHSRFVRDSVGDVTPLIPTLAGLRLFRDKHTAHRSIDLPKGESERLQALQAVALTPRSGRLFQARRGRELLFVEDEAVPWIDAYLGYQIQKGTPDTNDLVPERDHPRIMGEAYSVLERLLAV